jgi:predicted DNA-binding protein YlxM (UPF0122 family)
MAKARVRASISDTGLTRSELEMVIREAALGIEDTRIAEMYLLDGIAHVDIGEEVGLSRSAVSKRMPRIIDRVERTARKLHMI